MITQNTIRGVERERNLSRDAYFSKGYFSYEQLWSFVDQIYHINSFNPKNMVEIGIGNGFVSNFFKSAGVCVKTFDINPNLNPDIVAPVHHIDNFIIPGDFDLISCCEVLEHMPFENFEITIKMFSKLSNRLFLTLPVSGKKVGFGGIISLPKFNRWLGIWYKIFSNKNKLPKEHFWEIDYKNIYSKKNIIKIIAKYYLNVQCGLFKGNPYHQYFKCDQSFEFRL